jgi:hypothetical protein
MTIEQETLVCEQLAVLFAKHPKFICKNALKLRNTMPDVQFYAEKRNKRKKVRENDTTN